MNDSHSLRTSQRYAVFFNFSMIRGLGSFGFNDIGRARRVIAYIIDQDREYHSRISLKKRGSMVSYSIYIIGNPGSDSSLSQKHFENHDIIERCGSG